MKNCTGDLRGPSAGRQASIWAAVLLVAMGLSACGGGSGSAAQPGGGSSSGGDSPAPGGAGSIRVKVTDILGEAVAGAEVWVSATNTSALTGSDGMVRFDNVPAGRSRVCASHPVRGHTCSAPDPVTVEKDKILELARRLEQSPESAAIAVVLSTTVDPGGLGADGKSLDVTLRVAVAGPQFRESWFIDDATWEWESPQAFDCTARTGDELGRLGPRCIRGVDGSDSSYSFASLNYVGKVKTVEAPGIPWAVGLLVDQGDTGLSPGWLPNDPRLFAAKVFSDRLLPGIPLLLGAFASDEPSGSASPLPQRPMTLFPVESPTFLASRGEAFGILDDLQELVGGGAPLYQAIAEAVDYMAARTPPERKRALVVLADGADTTCGTTAQCAMLRREIIERAGEAAVQLFMVGGTGSDCVPRWVGWYDGCEGFVEGHAEQEQEAIQLLAREGGFPIVIGTGTTIDQRPAMDLAGQWLTGSMMVQDIGLRLTSEKAGAFAPGATVMGRLTGSNLSQCPMFCQVHQFIFSVEVPR